MPAPLPTRSAVPAPASSRRPAPRRPQTTLPHAPLLKHTLTPFRQVHCIPASLSVLRNFRACGLPGPKAFS
jgi:hypothetical protein